MNRHFKKFSAKQCKLLRATHEDKMDFTISMEKSEIRRRHKQISLLEYANSNREEGKFNDVKIEINDVIIPANRMVLSYCSTFFEKMFKTDMKESRENVAHLHDVDVSAVKQIVEYFYTGIIDINNENVLKVLAAADYLQLDEVKDFCSEFLQQVITTDSCANILAASKLYRLDSVEKVASQFIVDHFDSVTDKCCILTQNDFVALIAKLDRDKTKETYIYQALVEWVRYNEEERRNGFPNLLKLIQFEKLPAEFLKSVVSNEELVSQSSLCLSLVMNVSVQLLHKQSIRSGKKTRIISFGGSELPSRVVDVFNCFGDSLTQYPNLPFNCSKVICGESKNVVYSIGSAAWSGEYKLNDAFLHLKAVAKPNGYCQAAIHNNLLVVMVENGSVCRLKCFFPELRSWVDGPTMQLAGSNSCELVSSNESLYALGGVVNNNCSSNVELLPSLSFEKYDYSCNKNCLTAEEKSRLRAYCSKCSSRSSSLFSFGAVPGTGESAFVHTTPPAAAVQSIRSFIRVYGEWKTVQHMQIPRSSFSAVSCFGKIYAIGGQTHTSSTNATKSVERYDPTTNSWTYVCEMNYPRSDHAACVMEGKICVVGGRDNDGEAVTAIECYDPSDDRWAIVGNLHQELCGHSLITV